jgi:sulfite dehydrogenase (cytochrome) subunit B
MNHTRIIVAALAMGLSVVAARADELAIKLKPGDGLETVQNNCAACHSLDYVLMNSPFMDAKTWTAEVTKMKAAFGADISDADAKIIADYLTRNYGG